MSTVKAPPKMFVLFDGRAKTMDTDDAAVLDTAETEQEAVAASRGHKQVDAVWFEYDLESDNHGAGTYHNEKKRMDIGRKWLL